MRIEEDVKLNFKDVLLKPKRSGINSRSDVDLIRSFRFKNSGKTWSGVPIVASNMQTVGTFAMYNALKKFRISTCIHKHYTKLEWRHFLESIKGDNEAFQYMAITCGISDNEYMFFQEMMQNTPEIEYICFDVANGYTQRFIDFIKRARDTYPDKTIIAGNVVTGEMTEELILSGADIVKVGIGQGSTGKTRNKTGVGYPQFSAIIECADAAHGLKGHIMSDGGCMSPGDVAKAIGAGADFVMLGGLLTGHDENGGDIVTDKDNPHKKYKIFYGNRERRIDEDDNSKYGVQEGDNILIGYKGPVENTAHELMGGLRSACAYIGASSLKEVSKRASFIKINYQPSMEQLSRNLGYNLK